MFEIKSASAKKREKTGFSQQQTKRNNTLLLFNLIRKNSPISRIMLAEATGLSATTVSMLIEDLIASNLVREIGGFEAQARGRRPIMLEVNGTGGYFVLVEMTNTGLNFHLYNLQYQHIDFMQHRAAGQAGQKAASEWIGRLLERNGIPSHLLLGINIIYPGIVDKATKKMVYSAIVTDPDLLNDSEVASLQRQYPKAPVMVTNYSAVTAYAEYAFNDYHYNRTLVSVSIFEAVGAGAIFVNDRGEKTVDLPLELGHMMVDKNGPVCKCGNRGCLEALSGACALFKRVEQEAGLQLEYYDEFDHSKNIECMKTVAQLAADGNEAVNRVLDETAYWIAFGLTNMNNIIDPGYIFISGSIRHLGDSFLERIREKMKKLNLKHTDFPSIISYTQLDAEERLKGGVAMMMDAIFRLEFKNKAAEGSASAEIKPLPQKGGDPSGTPEHGFLSRP